MPGELQIMYLVVFKYRYVSVVSSRLSLYEMEIMYFEKRNWDWRKGKIYSRIRHWCHYENLNASDSLDTVITGLDLHDFDLLYSFFMNGFIFTLFRLMRWKLFAIFDMLYSNKGILFSHRFPSHFSETRDTITVKHSLVLHHMEDLLHKTSTTLTLTFVILLL